AEEALSASERDICFDPPGQHYTGATQLRFWSGNDRLREITPSNPRQLWTVFRSSMISRRYASLHLRLQNLLPQQWCVTIPHGPQQWSQTRRDQIAPRTERFSCRIVMMPSHVLRVSRRGACSGRGSTRSCSRRGAWSALADSFRGLARSTTRRNSPDGAA